MLKILAGLVSGIVSGTGMGGGTILILFLTMFLGFNQHVAQATNLVFFIPTSIAAIIVNIKERNINWKVAVWITVSGIIGAIVGAIMAGKTEVDKLRKYFGLFLAIIAIHEIYSIIKKYIIDKKAHNKINKQET